MAPASRRTEFVAGERKCLEKEYHSAPDFYTCPVCDHASVTVNVANAQSYATDRPLSMRSTADGVFNDLVATIKCSSCGLKDSLSKGASFRLPVDFYSVWSDYYQTLEQINPEEWEHIQCTNPVLKARVQKVRAIQKRMKERQRSERISIMTQNETLEGSSTMRSLTRLMSEDGNRQVSGTSLISSACQSTTGPTTVPSVDYQSLLPSSMCPSFLWQPSCHLTVKESGQVIKSPSDSLKRQSRKSSPIRPEKRKSSSLYPGVKKFKADFSSGSIAHPLSFVPPNSITIDSFLLPPCDLFSPQFRCSTPIKSSRASRSVSQTTMTLDDLDHDFSFLCF